VKARLVGALRLSHNQERHDTLVAVLPGTPFSQVQDITALRQRFPGVAEILQTWFVNHDSGQTYQTQGFASLPSAMAILDKAIHSYQQR